MRRGAHWDARVWVAGGEVELFLENLAVVCKLGMVS
jgi:hypothetical protein